MCTQMRASTGTGFGGGGGGSSKTSSKKSAAARRIEQKKAVIEKKLAQNWSVAAIPHQGRTIAL